MQRSALPSHTTAPRPTAALTGAAALLCTAALLAPGCAAPGPTRSQPLPDPILATRRPAPPPPRSRPAPPSPVVRPTPAPQPVPADWTPPGGIARHRWKVIVVHHSASVKSTPAGMHSWHLQRGWEGGLGYHFVIGNGVNYPDGQVYVGPRWRKQATGAHCKAGSGKYFGVWRPDNFFNANGIGICLIGNFENSQPTARQLAALKRLVEFLCTEADIPAGQVYGHGEVTHKTECPGSLLNMAAVRRSITPLHAASE